MSISEITVVILVILLILKPEDIPLVIKKLQEIKSYFTNFKNSALFYINKNDDGMLAEEIEQLNSYLQKITSVNNQYDGDYALEQVKHKYETLVASNMKNSLQDISVIAKDNHVVLVDEQDNILGIEDKFTVHNSATPLHRGFSVFLFNSKKEFLIQKRNSNKKTWPAFWSNSFCGHPRLNEAYEDAIHRHGKFELGITLQNLYFIDNYRYRFTLNNIVENEICPIYLALSDDAININKDEVEEIKMYQWSDFLVYLKGALPNFTPWCIEEVNILEKSNIFKKFMDSNL